MAFVFNTIPRPKVLHAHIVGEFSLASAKRHFLEIISVLEKHRCEKILIDGRGIVGDPEAVERFYYGEFVAHEVRRLRDRFMPDSNPPFAYVMQEPMLDPRRLGETVAVNRGMNVKTFDDLDAAIKWLGLTPEDLLDT